MLNGYLAYKILFALLLVAIFCNDSLVAGIERIGIENEYNSEFLPYDFVQKYSVDYGVSRKVILNPIQVYQEKTSDTSQALIISAYNGKLNEDRPASILLMDQTATICMAEDPIYVTLSDYFIYHDDKLGQKCVIAGCYRNDSAFVVKDVPGGNRHDYLFLTSGRDFTGNGVWEPSVFHIATNDYDFDGHLESFFYVFSGRDSVPRTLYCIEIDNLTIEWSLPVASYLRKGNLLSCQDSLNPSVIFTTYGTSNGVADSNFDDHYGYLTKVNARGDIVFNQRILSNFTGTILLPINEEHSQFCHYRMAVTAADSLSAPSGQLTIIDRDGNLLHAVKEDAVLVSAWLGDYARDANKEIYSSWSDGKIRIYNTTLNLVAESGPSALTEYVGQINLGGNLRPVFVLGNAGGIGLYDGKFQHLADFPGIISSARPLEIDRAGNTRQLILCGGNTGYILEIKKKNLVAYVRLVFWEYQHFILAMPILLLMGLLSLNYFRKKTSAKLTASEEKYRALMKGVGEAIFTINRDGVYLFMNAIGAQRLGGKPEDFVGKNTREIFPEEVAEAQMVLLKEIFDSGEPRNHERILKLGEDIRRINSSLWPIRNSKGEVDVVLGIATDITNLFEARIQLERERNFTASILHASNSLIVCLDAKARIVIFNSELERVTGYGREEVIGKSWPEIFLPKEYHHEGLKNFAEWVKLHPANRGEGSIIAKSGELRAILWSNSALFSPETGEMTMAIAVGYDITERKKVEKGLRESEEKLRVMFDTAVDGIMIADLRLNIIQANQATARILGFKDKADLIGHNALEFANQEDRDAVKANLERALHNDSIAFAEFVCIRADREEIPVEISAAAMRIEAGEIIGFAAGLRDCTVRKTVELRDKSRLRLLQNLRKVRSIDECLESACQAIYDSRLFKRAVLTLHDDKREIINLGQIGLDLAIVEKARRAPAPNQELSKQMTQEKYRISHSYFVPSDSGLISSDFERLLPQEDLHRVGADPWRIGDELFVPIMADGGEIEGWLSVDTPFDGNRPKIETIIHLEEIVDIVTKKVHEIQSLEKLTLEQKILQEINKALHESEERYRGLVETARDVIFTINPNGVIDSLNPAFEQVTGWSATDWLGKSFEGLIHPADLELGLDNFRRVYRGETPPVYELRILTNSGHYLVGEFLNTPQIVGGKVAKSLGIARDVTERKRVEKELLDSEERFKHIAEHSLQGMYILQNGKFIFSNARMAEIYDATLDEIINSNLKEFINRWIHPEYFNLLTSRYESRIAGDDAHSQYEVRIITKSGQERWIEHHTQVVSFRGQRSIYGVILDVTGRKKAELALESRLASESLIASISSSFINLSSDEISIGIDQALRKIAEFSGADISYLFSISDDKQRLTGTHRWISPTLGCRIDLIADLPMEKFRWSTHKLSEFEDVHISSANNLPPEAEAEREALSSFGIKSIITVPMVYGRNLIGGLGFIHARLEKSWDDETIALLRIIGEIFANALQRQKTEQTLQRINQEKYQQARQIAGGFAHEMRNALFPARGSLNLLKKTISEQFYNDTGLHYLQKISDDAITRAIDITALISHFTKLDSEHLPGNVELNNILKEILAANQIRINEQKVEVDILCPSNLWVESNRRQLFLALNNLFINSLDALLSRSSPLILIKGAPENGYLNLLFSDNGIGISEEHMGRIFEAFYSTKPDRGTGLGLAISKKIIEMYGGGISAWSRPNEGTKFNIKLKLVDRNLEGSHE